MTFAFPPSHKMTETTGLKFQRLNLAYFFRNEKYIIFIYTNIFSSQTFLKIELYKIRRKNSVGNTLFKQTLQYDNSIFEFFHISHCSSVTYYTAARRTKKQFQWIITEISLNLMAIKETILKLKLSKKKCFYTVIHTGPRNLFMANSGILKI